MPAPGPVDALTHTLLRAAVLAHCESERRRRFPAKLHVGVPDRSVHVHESGPSEDDALRADLAGALVQRWTRDPVLRGDGDSRGVLWSWLTRPGTLCLHDDDVAWGRALRRAAAEAGVPAEFVVVTREGWWDPITGVQTRWSRLRRRRRAGAGAATGTGADGGG